MEGIEWLDVEICDWVLVVLCSVLTWTLYMLSLSILGFLDFLSTVSFF